MDSDTVGMEMGSRADAPESRSCGFGSLVKYCGTWPCDVSSVRLWYGLGYGDER